MTQNDLDNGRLICLIGVAPTYPAEFVIFRIGQWTADAAARPEEEHMAIHATTRTARSTSWSSSAATGHGDEGQIVGGFSDVSGLGIEVKLLRVPQRQRARSTHVRKVAEHAQAPTTSPSSAALVGDRRLFDWLKGDARGRPSTAQTVTITLLDEAREPVATLSCLNAQPKKWVGPTLAAKGGGEVAMEELHLVARGHRVPVVPACRRPALTLGAPGRLSTQPDAPIRALHRRAHGRGALRRRRAARAVRPPLFDAPLGAAAVP